MGATPQELPAGPARPHPQVGPPQHRRQTPPLVTVAVVRVLVCFCWAAATLPSPHTPHAGTTGAAERTRPPARNDILWETHLGPARDRARRPARNKVMKYPTEGYQTDHHRQPPPGGHPVSARHNTGNNHPCHSTAEPTFRTAGRHDKRASDLPWRPTAPASPRPRTTVT
jgi:hypothetical protein